MSYQEEYEKLLKQHQHLNNRVNKVTAYWRHGSKVPDDVMSTLCNTQLEVEKRVEQIESSVFADFIINE